MMRHREQMNIVVVGHVDHGKSTVIGRLMSDTHSLPEGKLEQVRANCARNARPFEYAFLLDALKDEQSQGITIDSARCFFKTAKRDYIIIDAPGHIEFLKNMVSGAARAEAAVLVIDAKEGVRENSKRHGFLLSMLGIRQILVLVNKMDLVDYREAVFRTVQSDYADFLKDIHIQAQAYIPVSAREGDNIVAGSEAMPWYSGMPFLPQLDAFAKEASLDAQPFRMPVQDIYKFTQNKDDRRIFAGTVESGSIQVGDEIIFLPSGKQSRIKTIECFHAEEKKTIHAGYATGFTLTEEIYIRRGEILCKLSEPRPETGIRFRVNIFWMGRMPMIMNRKYKLKLGTSRAVVRLVEIKNILDASDLSSSTTKKQIERHDVAECILETTRPIAFDLSSRIAATGRFVIVDNFEISGGGIMMEAAPEAPSVLEKRISQREINWEHSEIGVQDRVNRFRHKSKFIIFTGPEDAEKKMIARMLEKKLFQNNFFAYYLGVSSLVSGLDTDVSGVVVEREKRIRRLGELARIFTDSGQIFISTMDDLDDYDMKILKMLNEPNEILVVNVGGRQLYNFKPDVDIAGDLPVEEAVARVYEMLGRKEIILDYAI